MAITVKEAHTKLVDSTLSKDEERIFKQIESYVDKEIERLYDAEISGGVHISSDIINFDWLPTEDTHYVINSYRKIVLNKRLIKTYQDAGWCVKESDHENQYVFSNPDFMKNL